jgi:hypothetical protein
MKVTAGDLLSVMSACVRDNANAHSEVTAQNIFKVLETVGCPSLRDLVRIINGDSRVVEVVKVNDCQGEGLSMPRRFQVPVRQEPGTVIPFRREK